MLDKLKSVRILPFNIHDRSDYVVEEHPEFHPIYEGDKYNDYWLAQIKYCLKGKWGLDYNEETGEGGWRWCPGNLYFYVNAGTIKVEGTEGSEDYARPALRDIEWYICYALSECDGFSGFSEDEKYTSFEPIGKLQGKIRDSDGKKMKLTNKDKIKIDQYKEYLLKPDGTYKEYIPAKEALYKTYDKEMGRALYMNEKKNLVVLSSRGVGKSYITANAVIMYDFVFGSSLDVEDFQSRSKPSTVVVGSYDTSKSSALLGKFEDSYERMRKEVGAFFFNESDPYDDVNSPFYQPFDGSTSPGSRITNRVREERSKSYNGTGSEVWHVSYRVNAQAGVGYRARRMVIEEAGLLANFEDVHRENEGSQERENKIGYTIYIGTGGDIEKITGIRKAFYDPAGFRCVGFPDLYKGTGKQIGLFIPSYYRSMYYKDPQGNTKVEEAFEDEMEIRKEKLKRGSKIYDGYAISYPIMPSEMFLNSGTNTFPTALLQDRITDLETGEWERLATPVNMTYLDKARTKVRLDKLRHSDVRVIKSYGEEDNLSDEELKGCPVIYEEPKPYRPGLTFNNYLYIVVYDSVKDDTGGTSLACVQVWKLWDLMDPNSVQMNMVAEWIGRNVGNNGLEKDHEVAYMFSALYDAPILPEINLRDILRYGRSSNRFFRFLPKPTRAIEGMEIKQKKEYPVGMYISPGMTPDLELYLYDALHTVARVEHTIEGSNEQYKEIKVVSEIPSLRLCEELLYYDRDGNYDAVSSAFLFAVVKKQRQKSPVTEEMAEQAMKDEEEFIEVFEGKQEDQFFERKKHPGFNY